MTTSFSNINFYYCVICSLWNILNSDFQRPHFLAPCSCLLNKVMRYIFGLLHPKINSFRISIYSKLCSRGHCHVLKVVILGCTVMILIPVNFRLNHVKLVHSNTRCGIRISFFSSILLASCYNLFDTER